MIYALIAIQQAAINQKIDQAFMRAIEDLPDDVREKMTADRNKRKMLASKEAEDERRHREICDAIRSTSFWRF